jgi:hypothetical protein
MMWEEYEEQSRCLDWQKWIAVSLPVSYILVGRDITTLLDNWKQEVTRYNNVC